MKETHLTRKVDKALFPRAGLIVEFSRESEVFAYLFKFFSDYKTGSGEEFMEQLTKEGILSTVITTNGIGGPKSKRYVLDCHKLLVRLSIIEQTEGSVSMQLYTIQEVASLLRVTRQTVYNLISAGHLKTIQLKGIKGQRIPKRQVEIYIANQDS